CSRQNAGRSALQLPPLGSGNVIDYLVDGSGRGHHLVQPFRAARPRFRQEFTGAFAYFDGTNDVLHSSNLHRRFTNLTVFVVAAPHSNQGEFRAFFAMNQAGANDYPSGLNFDLGPSPTSQLAFLNTEGSGFGGARQLLQSAALPFGRWHVFAVQAQS